MEKRNFSRVDFRIRAELDIDGKKFEGQVTNLSLKGLLFLSDILPEIGTKGILRIHLTNSDEFGVMEFESKVVREVSGGVGVFIEKMDLESFDHLSKIIEYNIDNPEIVKDEMVAYISKNIRAKK